MGYPVVHFEINTASQSDLARFYEEAFGWTTHADGDDYLQINTNGVCAGTGEPGIEGGSGPSDPGDDFVEIGIFRDPHDNRIGLVRG